MRLDKAIKILKEEIKPEENQIAMELDIQAIETVLKALENSIPKKKIKDFIKEELPDDEICAVCDIYDVNGVEIKQKLQELLEKPNE